MEPVAWNKECYIIDGQPAFLISGEFHYFRVPYGDWRRRLELFKAAGGNCVATYIPWLLHEPKEGSILFGDEPILDLEGFLRLCAELDLYVLCRPGPYQYSELRYDGLPDWLCENYPELLARDINGDAFRLSSVSYMHPLFLQKVKKWFDAVCPIIARHTIEAGGSVAMVQLDNELMGIHLWFGGPDYNRETMGFGSENGRYSRFLKERYGLLDKLNESYCSEYNAFSDVLPIAPQSIKTDYDRRKVKDYQDFYFSLTAEYASTLADWVREYGLDCPLVHNSGNPGMNSYFKETVAELGEGFLLGSDHYYNLGVDWPQNNPTPQYALKALHSCETLRCMGYPPTVFELPAGSCSDWPAIEPEDLKCCYYLNLAFGMKGLNYYIFTGGPNPAGTGAFGEDYDYGAPIGSHGQLRPSYEVLKEFGKFLRNNRWLCEAKRITDANVGFLHEYNRAQCYSESKTTFDAASAGSFLKKGLLTTALCASVSPEFMDLESEYTGSALCKPLIVPACRCMSAEAQRRLVRFITCGGKVLLAPVLPYMDENWNTCTILLDFLGCGQVTQLNIASPIANIGPIHNVLVNGSLYGCDVLPADAQIIGAESRSGRCIAWEACFGGGGKVLWLGLEWTHSKHEHTEMLKYLLNRLGMGIPAVLCSNPNLWTALWSNGTEAILFVMNLFSAQAEADVHVFYPGARLNGVHSLSVKPFSVHAI